MNRKVFVFTGSSITYGIGLQYESELSTIHWPFNEPWDLKYLDKAQEKFIFDNRFSKKVSNYFNGIELNYSKCSGNMAALNNLIDGLERNEFSLSDVNSIIFQVNGFPKDVLTLKTNDGRIVYADCEADMVDFLVKENKTIDNVIYDTISVILENIYNFALMVESSGVKFGLLVWPNNEEIRYIKEHPLQKYLIPLYYKNTQYDTIVELVNSGKYLTSGGIFGLKNGYDYHPSIEGHSIIASNIVKYLEL